MDYELADFCARGSEFAGFLSTSIVVMMFLFALRSVPGVNDKVASLLSAVVGPPRSRAAKGRGGGGKVKVG